MFLRSGLVVVAALLLLCAEAGADVYFEQDVHATQRGAAGADEESHFKRKIFVLGSFLAIQIEESGALRKEYGFDFAKGLYYEADPDAGYYKWFDLKRLAEAFGRMSRGARTDRRPDRRSIAAGMARDLVNGRLDYPVSVQRALFGKKKIGDQEARLYILREGPGSSFINPFGWYRKARIWASDQMPGTAEYGAVQKELAKKAAFYKIKRNRVSDLLTTLAAMKPFPLVIDSTANKRFIQGDPVETSRETISLIRTSPVDRQRLLYFSQRQRFSWNVVFSEGTEFGPEPSRGRSDSFDLMHALPWLAIPAAFFVCLYLWFLGGYSDKEEIALDRFVVEHVTVLSALLLVWEVAHYLGELPFLGTPLLELELAAGSGVFWIAWQARAHLREVDRRMKESHLRFCPYCHARCEEFYVECPKCNRPLPKRG